MSFIKNLFPGKSEFERSSDQMLINILSTLRESAMIVGEDTRILAANQAAYEAFGRNNGPLTEKRLTGVIRDLTLHEAFRAAIEEEKTSEIELELVGNESRKYSVRVAPLQIPGTKAAIGYFHDVTQIDRLERVRQEFLSNVSHELRTPLTSIIAFAETLEDGAIEDRENNTRFLRVIQRNAERMHRLIDDILELSSIESGNISIERQQCRLGAVIGEIFTSLSEKAAESGVELISEIGDDVRVHADPMRLEQMLVNLIDNAIKFNRQGGKVTVSHQGRNGFDVISIADIGEGIASDHLPRLFERFYRTDRARSREIGGTGLGLAITKHLALLHEGEVSVSSVLGEGSTFSVELPRR